MTVHQCCWGQHIISTNVIIVDNYWNLSTVVTHDVLKDRKDAKKSIGPTSGILEVGLIKLRKLPYQKILLPHGDRNCFGKLALWCRAGMFPLVPM